MPLPNRSNTVPRVFSRLIFLSMALFLSLYLSGPAHASNSRSLAPTSNPVIDGNARFMVLTPTLIRLEYAGSAQFEDRTSINIVNRNLPIPDYTTQVINGWRQIQTDKLLLSYKENSGPFGPDNLNVQLTVSNQTVTAIPSWEFAPNCIFATRCEGENATLSGGTTIASDHTGYSGSGFVAGYRQAGARTTWTLHDVSATGASLATIRYANAIGGDGQDTTRTLSLYVNGSKTGQVTLPTTADWNSWNTIQQPVTLNKGDNTLALSCDAGDSCNVNVDNMTAQAICAVGQVCQGTDASFAGGAAIASDHLNYTGTGFIAGYGQSGAKATWTVHNVPNEADRTVTVRYANYLAGDNQRKDRSLSVYVNNNKAGQITLPQTSSWDSWNQAQQTVHLTSGDNTVALVCDPGDSCDINVNSIAITDSSAALPLMDPSNLGGWYRSLDGESGSVPLHDGLLTRDGWYLLNDSQTALWSNNWATPRPDNTGGYQDGYFFGYGHDYQTGLSDFAKVSGSAPILPRWAFGNWYSRYYAYDTNTYQQTLLPKFRSEQVPLDTLVVDTDWKSPSQWNGWNWNSNLFPDPQSFLDWAKQQGLHVTLNIHSSIQGDDPKFAQANADAGGLIDNGNNNYVWDWSNQNQANSYFNLHQPFDKQGIRFWWLDWCCDSSRVSMPGLTPDTWINYLYAKDATDKGLRGFAFSRAGSGLQGYSNTGYTTPAGPWGDHRYTVQFTGDTYDTWDMLNFQSLFTTREGNIGMPYVTHDLGSFHGGHLSDDMYVRWLQLGTFQPILRMHSDHGDRLPWNYDDAARIPAEQFLRLREALVPYLYTLSSQAYSQGLPMARGLYLNYPDDENAYAYDHEYMLGDQMLVAPIASPGNTASTQVWLPSGQWTNFFTGQTYTGPSVQTVTCDLSCMPVFVKSGGIVPMQPYMDYVGQKAVDPLNIKVYPGADGSFSLYEDEGENLNYQQNKSATTPINFNDGQHSLTIGTPQGSYDGMPSQRGYDIDFVTVNAPNSVSVGSQNLNQSATGEGWSYDSGSKTLHVRLNARSTSSAVTVSYS